MELNKLIEECKATKSTRLDIGMCGLFAIPEEVFELEHLKVLILSNFWSDIEQGERAYSSNSGKENCIIYISDKICNLINLETLILQGHFLDQEITNIEAILKLKNLSHLNISYCCKSKFFTSFIVKFILIKIAKLKNSYIFVYNSYKFILLLTELYFNVFNRIKKAINKKEKYYWTNSFINLSALSNLKHLNIAGCKPKTFVFLENLCNLTSLSSFNNNIDDISFIENFQQISFLNLSSNKINNLEPLKNKLGLKKLYLGNNQISDITPLASLIECEILNLQSNKIESLIPLQNITSLKVLFIGENEITDIKPLSNLTNLKTLVLSKNKIIDIEAIIPLLKRGVPIKLSDSNAIQGIFISQNPIVIPPVEILEKGSDTIINYYEEKETTGSEYLFESKLLIVGEGGVGKTSLARKLLDINYPLPTEEESTHGIQVHKIFFDVNEKTKFRLHIWDFGGQEIYHATHQFFLTRRSLYLFIDDTRKDDKTIHDDSFNYWLQVIELLGSGSPVIIIQNEKSDRSKSLDLQGILSRFPFIKDVKQTNLLTGRGVQDVFESIKFHVKNLPQIGELLPNSWLSIRKDLEEISKNRDYISVEKYFEICAKFGLDEGKSIFLSDYLHDLGIFLHFRDSPALKNIFILNNQWATDAVYKILDNEKVKRNNGRFSREDIEKIWSDQRYIRKHDELISLMEKFELCYKLTDSKIDSWLAPQLLPIEKPLALEWFYEHEIVIKFHYEFMPKGILTRFIVRMQRYIKDINSTWRKGVVLERNKSFALVTETWGSREIIIKATGIESKDLMTIIIEDFDRIHGRFENLRVEKFIPCICKVCKNSLTPHFFEYSRLEKRKLDGKLTIECDNKPYEQVEIKKMIEGVFTKINMNPDMNDLRSLLSEGKLEEAMNEMLEYFPEVNLLQGRLSHAKREYTLGKINLTEYDVIRQKTSSSIFDMINNKI